MAGAPALPCRAGAALACRLGHVLPAVVPGIGSSMPIALDPGLEQAPSQIGAAADLPLPARATSPAVDALRPPWPADNTWQLLESAIQEINNHNASGLSFEELYRWVGGALAVRWRYGGAADPLAWAGAPARALRL